MRIIDADALKKSVPNTHVDIFENCRNCELLDDEQVKEFIDNAPAIDAVPVVRCKDCRWRDAEEKHHCIDINRVFDPMDFCSFGEREDNESNGD